MLVVLALFAVIAGFIIIGFRNFAGFQQFNQAVGTVEFTLEQTRLFARSAVGDSAHGVKIGTSSLTQFVGDVYSVSDPDNVVVNFSLVTFTPNLVGGVDEIVFAKLTGLPSATGTVLVEGLNFSASSTIEMTDTGVIQ